MRSSGTLAVLGAFTAPGASAAAISGEQSAELRDLASWLGLDTAEISGRGDLAAELRSAST